MDKYKNIRRGWPLPGHASLKMTTVCIFSMTWTMKAPLPEEGGWIDKPIAAPVAPCCLEKSEESKVLEDPLREYGDDEKTSGPTEAWN